MKIIDLQQGTPEWAAHRATARNASEAPSVMGASKYTNRSELLRLKKTGIAKEIDAATQRRFDEGHRTEAAARALVEEMIGEEFYPVVGESDDGYLSASFDGITMDGSTGFEHKLWNEALVAAVRAGELPPAYYWQLEQQILVGGMEKIIFVCSDGTRENFASMEYRAVPGRAEQLIAAWKQFDADLATYEYEEVIPAAVVAPIADLPALSVQIRGEVVASNLDYWQSIVADRIAAINTDLQSDEDFAVAEKTVKFLDDGEKKLDLVKAQAQAQAADIDALFRAVDAIKAEMRAKRLNLDKLVVARKNAIRSEIMRAAQAKLDEHVRTLNERIGWFNGCPFVSPAAADFQTAIKNKRTIASLRDACDTELARAKIAASELADRIETNRKAMGEHANLFPDVIAVCTKPVDDFANLLAMRLQQQKDADAKRLAAQNAAHPPAPAVQAPSGGQPQAVDVAAPVVSIQPQENAGPTVWEKTQARVVGLLNDLTISELEEVARFIGRKGWRKAA